MAIALSIRQPWTELILQGRKTIEVRSWTTQHRGELLLHAGARPDTLAMRALDLKTDEFVLGAIVGTCELYECIEFSDVTWECWRSAHLNEGPLERRHYAWLLRNPRRIEPRAFKGRLGLMRVEDMDTQ